MNALGCTVVGMILTRRHGRAARSLPCAALVAHREGLRRDRDPLSRRDAGDPAAARARGGRDDAQRALRLRRRRRSAPSGNVRAPLRLSADRGLGDDRDRRRRRHLHGRRAAPCRQALHRARDRRWTIASSTTPARTCSAGEAGELLVRQKGDEPRRGFFSEYLKDEAATAEAWAGGWFHTGDVVHEATTARCSSSTARRTSCAARARTSR